MIDVMQYMSYQNIKNQTTSLSFQNLVSQFVSLEPNLWQNFVVFSFNYNKIKITIYNISIRLKLSTVAYKISVKTFEVTNPKCVKNEIRKMRKRF